MKLGFQDKRELQNYILYAMGTLVSLIGSVLYTFVMSLFILEKTGSGIFFSLNLALSVLPVILVMPAAGLLADKADKKKIIVGMDALSALLLLGIFFHMRRNDLSLPVICLTTLLLSLFTTVLDTAFSAARVSLVSRQRLVLLNSTSDIISSLARIIGPLLGGILFAALDLRWFILGNGISYLLSAVSELFIHFDYNPGPPSEQTIDFIRDMRDGFDYIRKRADLKRYLGIFLVINLSLSLSVIVPLPVVANQILQLGSANYGLIQAGFSAGIILGAAVSSRVLKRFSYAKLFRASLLNFAVLIALFGAALLIRPGSADAAAYVLYYLAVLGLTGVSVSCIDIPFITYLQTQTDRRYLGRVIGIAMSVAKVTAPLAYLLSGFLLERMRADHVILSGTLILFGYHWFTRGTRSSKDAACDENAA